MRTGKRHRHSHTPQLPRAQRPIPRCVSSQYLLDGTHFDERGKLQRHTQIGYEMLAKLDLKFLEVEECVTDHHERITGTGYPQRKMGGAVGEVGRVCALADSYCAMTVKRIYAEAMEPMKAAAALVQDPGYDAELSRHLQALLVTTGKHKQTTENQPKQ